MSSVSVITSLRLTIGESPLWDDSGDQLRVIDILGGSVHRMAPSGEDHGPDDAIDVGAPVGALVPRRSGGHVVAVGQDLLALDGHGVRPLLRVEPDEDVRLNDAACDPAGRLVIGSTAGIEATGRGSLYRVDPDHTVNRLRTGATMSNGIGWSPAGDRLYFADSADATVYAYPYSVRTGDIGEGEPFVVFADGEGAPDGLAVDVAGGVWIASFGGGFVRRHTPDGAADRTIRLPCDQVTNCCFGGAGGDTLFITTAHVGLDDHQRAAQPLAGAVFRTHVGIRGLPVGSYAG
jgi:sugar lactone lactonase YvrE